MSVCAALSDHKWRHSVMQDNQHHTCLCFQLGISEIGIQKALLNWAREHHPEGKHPVFLYIIQRSVWMCEFSRQKKNIAAHTGYRKIPTKRNMWSLNHNQIQQSKHILHYQRVGCKKDVVFVLNSWSEQHPSLWSSSCSVVVLTSWEMCSFNYMFIIDVMLYSWLPRILESVYILKENDFRIDKRAWIYIYFV